MTDAGAEKARPQPDEGPSLPLRLLFVLGLLIVGLGLSAFLAEKEKSRLDGAALHRFQVVCDTVRHTLDERLMDAAQFLRSGAALFDTANAVSRRDWRVFSTSLDFGDSLSGIQGIGFSELIPRDGLAAHEAKIRAEGFPEYSVRPSGVRPQYSAIVYLEPFVGRNLRAFGYDMFSEPVRRAAMERARDQNRVVLSGKVQLVQETDTDVQAGLLMFVPVYGRGLPIDTVEQRRRAIFGWVYSPYRMTDFIDNSLKGMEDMLKGQGITLAIFDGTGTSPDSLLYGSAPRSRGASVGAAPATLSLALDFGESRWTLRFERPGDLLSPAESRRVWLIFFGGTMLTLLIVGLAYSLNRTQENARAMARRMTAQLRESEASLRESRENLGAALDASEESIYLIASDGTLLALNTVAAGRLGRPVKDLVGHRSGEIFPADLEERRRPHLERALNEGRPTSYEEEAEGRLLVNSLYPIVGEEGRAERLAIYSRDITDRRKSQEEVAFLLARYHSLLETASDGIHVLDTDGNLVEANAAFCSMLGYGRDEIIGLNVAAWDRRWSGESLAPRVRSLIARPEVFETTHQRKDGSLFEVEINAVGVTLQGRDYLYAAARDITERKNVESVLKESEDRYRSLFESALDAILLTAPSGEILTANKAACQMFGMSEAQIVAGGRGGILDGSDPRLGPALEERRISGRFYGELTFRRANGEKFPGEISSNVFVDRRGEARTSMQIRDVTESKATLAALHEALATNKNLLGELQHRVKNSFNLISSLVSLAASEASQEESKLLLEELDGRVMSVARLYTLLYASGSFEEIRLDSYCAEVVAALSPLAGSIGLETKMDPLTIAAKTAAPIGLIATELVTNSLKYAFPEKRGGQTIRLSLRIEGGEGRLEVADNGVGLPPGFSLASSGGTGLILVQGLAKQIGGSFGMMPVEIGTRWLLNFPLGPAE